MNSKQAGIFFDRDGTINIQNDFVRRPDGLALVEKSVAVGRETNQTVRKVFVDKNQSGTTRGFLSEYFLAAGRKRLRERPKKQDPHTVADFYYPHHSEYRNPSSNVPHQCRTAEFGVLRHSVAEFNLVQKNFCVVDNAYGVWLQTRHMIDHQRTPVA